MTRTRTMLGAVAAGALLLGAVVAPDAAANGDPDQPVITGRVYNGIHGDGTHGEGREAISFSYRFRIELDVFDDGSLEVRRGQGWLRTHDTPGGAVESWSLATLEVDGRLLLPEGRFEPGCEFTGAMRSRTDGRLGDLQMTILKSSATPKKGVNSGPVGFADGSVRLFDTGDHEWKYVPVRRT